ncbi:NADP-dependent oxidoreductase domain-containing protein [Thamnocephalis sphaerospora]|uniref:NADP-dependent oxidoreductase domain-containing protein n=1 Tax=Thamnocephalis sphaerospora TaxID=78915 RepID=A0A4P9XTV7_9FUNG|nr:NADP-dependent oxidoreductase domain-containing protein [Thamnocephalis sphaerospora]|eukprot:RKP09422.1 NADP-dependent oxidoreductase domain-containing protein [Thamnocephalis sphaerospora]
MEQTRASVTLANGVSMPLLGLGTYRVRDEPDLERCIRAALDAGYRMFDTAAVYRNEEAIGRVLARLLAEPAFSHLTRKDLFITTKLAPRDQGYEACLAACEASLRRLGLDYVDLYLIHWPGTQRLKAEDPRNAENRAGSWRALEDLWHRGGARAIGVSNYTVQHLQALLDHCTVRPAVLQTEMHPLWPEPELRAFCQREHIHLEAYSSLGEGALVSGALSLPTLHQLAAACQRTPAQLLLRWAIQHGATVIPKSTQPERIRENAQSLCFSLTAEQMAALDKLAEASQLPLRRFCWDPSRIV